MKAANRPSSPMGTPYSLQTISCKSSPRRHPHPTCPSLLQASASAAISAHLSGRTKSLSKLNSNVSSLTKASWAPLFSTLVSVPPPASYVQLAMRAGHYLMYCDRQGIHFIAKYCREPCKLEPHPWHGVGAGSPPGDIFQARLLKVDYSPECQHCA